MNEEKSRLDKFIIHLLNFNNIAPNLLSTSDDIYERFFEKLYNIDKRALYLYIMYNKESITESQILFSKNYYEKRGRFLDWDKKIKK